MNMVEIILKKRHQEALSTDEIRFFIHDYVSGKIPDYQISSLLMAIVFNGMNERETADLTKAMIDSGEQVNLHEIHGVKVDKHSTGGVGDKTSLVLGPMVAACGAKVAKMSGRGLGHTGGTLDKLEAIPNFKIERSKEEFISQVNRIGISIMGQSKNLVPADKKLYALRDVTGTVDSIPLIASSIMSKKIATGADSILLDVKFGSGAFFQSIEDSKKLAQAMVKIGRNLGRDTRALLSAMEQPLGRAIGNTLEVKEAIATLKGQGPDDLLELCLIAGSVMLRQASLASSDQVARQLLLDSISSGSAFAKFREFIIEQEGDISFIDNPNKFPSAKYIIPVIAPTSGYINQINALTLGEVAMKLGAGRAKKEDVIDYAAGLIIHQKVGSKVDQGDTLVELHSNSIVPLNFIDEVLNAFSIKDTSPLFAPIVHEIIE